MAGLLAALLLQLGATRAGTMQVETKPKQPLAPLSAKSGLAEDPPDDTHMYFGEEVPPDLLSAKVELSPDSGMSLTARFVEGTLSSKTTAVHFTFYSQAPTEPSACGDYLVNFNVAGAPRGEVWLRRHTQGTEYEDLAKGVAKLTTDAVTLTVPAAAFGGKLLHLTHWHVVVAIRLRDNAESRILDYLPDPDLPAATVEPSRGRRTRS
jgi:hypothetical protein